MKLIDILFFLFLAGGIAWLTWELIPDGLKKYWYYGWQVRRDEKKERRQRYSFIWKR